MEDKTFKTIIVISLIFIVAILGVSAYLFLNMENQKLSQNNISNITNQINSTINDTTNKTNKTTKTENKKTSIKITAKQAIKIVKNSIPHYNVNFGAELITSTKTPYYLVTAYDDDPTSESYGEPVGGAKVNAETGKIMYALG